jgi:hypothetical protein
MTSSAEEAVTLAVLQDWLRLAITTPGGPREGLRAAHERFGDRFPIRETEGVDVRERLAIYARGYLDRLIACLRSDYPAVRALVGDPLFERFATGYVWSRPPTGPNLSTLGARLADFLDETRPGDDAVPEDRRSLLRLPIDLARAERARLETLRAPGFEGETSWFDVTGFEPLFGDDLEVAVPSCLRIVELGHDVRGFLSAVDRGEAPSVPQPRPCILGVSRVDFRPVVTELTHWQRRTLAVFSIGRPVGAVADLVASELGESAGSVLADLWLWLPIAQGLGLLRARRGSASKRP